MYSELILSKNRLDKTGTQLLTTGNFCPLSSRKQPIIKQDKMMCRKGMFRDEALLNQSHSIKRKQETTIVCKQSGAHVHHSNYYHTSVPPEMCKRPHMMPSRFKTIRTIHSMYCKDIKCVYEIRKIDSTRRDLSGK